jgi:hypothetical protein
MKFTFALTAAVITASSAVFAQDKPVPKGSMRVSIPGCTRDYILTAIKPTEQQPGSLEVREGTHFRMNVSKTLMRDIHAHEGAVVVITGLVKSSQQGPSGIGIGGGIRVAPGTGGGRVQSASPAQNYIDVEGWRQGVGECPH